MLIGSNSTRWFAAALGLALLFAACQDDAASEPPSPPAAVANHSVDPQVIEALGPDITQQMIEDGHRLFLVCSPCHGPDARGTQLGPALRDGEWIHIDGEIDQIIEITRSGVDAPRLFPVPMPAMGGGDFNEEELRALGAFLYALARSGS